MSTKEKVKRITQERLNELASLPRLNWRDMFAAEDGITPEDEAAMDSYFAKFVKMDGGKCINCARTQGGFRAALIGGGFTYDLTHGEGHCRTCGYPGRANHYDIGPIKSLEVILQYHPSQLTLKSEGKEKP